MARVLSLIVGEEKPLEEASRVIRGGGVVAFPTESSYGLGADPFQRIGIERIFEAKGRDPDKPLPLIAATLDQVRSLFQPFPETAARLAKAFWPGPLTLVLAAPPGLQAAVVSPRGGAGVRVPSSVMARSVVRAYGGLLTATSANLSGSAPAVTAEEVLSQLGHSIDLILDGGEMPGGPPSTVLELLAGSTCLAREGAIAAVDLERVLGSAIERRIGMSL